MINIIFLNSKEDYLEIHDKLYECINETIESKTITRFNYKVFDYGYFYTPPRDKRNFTANIPLRLSDIRWIQTNIEQELIQCISYNKLYELSKDNSFIRSNVIIPRENYLKLVSYDLYSLRENLAILIFNMFDRKILYKGDELNDGNLMFYKVYDGLKYINLKYNNIDWISQSELNIIKTVLKHNFNNKRCNSYFKKIRHKYTHSYSPEIGFMPPRSFEFRKVSPDMQKMLRYQGGENEIKNADSLIYRETSATPIYEKIEYQTVISDLVFIWNEFNKGLKKLINEVAVLKKEIECIM